MQAGKGFATALTAALGIVMAASVHEWSVPDSPVGRASQVAASAPKSVAVRSRAMVAAADAAVPFSLSLRGDVSGLAVGASATATVWIGGRSYPAAVLGNAYTATFDALSGDEMVAVEVVSTRARYRSVLGSAARLAAAAGSDGEVTQAELASLRVSPFSSALAYMLRSALGGRDAVSDAEFENLTRSVVGDQLAVAAYALEGWTQGTMALPPGFADGQQVLEAPAAYSEATWNVDPQAARAYLFEQADKVPLADLAQLPDALAMLGPVPVNEPAVAVSNVQLLYRQSDGVSYALFEEEPLAAHPRYAAALTADGAVALSPVGEAGTRNMLAFLPWDLFVPAVVQRVSHGHALRRLVVGDVYSLWMSRSVWLDSHHSAAGDYEQEAVEYAVWSAFDLHAVAATHPWSELLGGEYDKPTFVLPIPCHSSRRAPHLPAFGKCPHEKFWFGNYPYGGQVFRTDDVGDRMQYQSVSEMRSFSRQIGTDGGLQLHLSAPAGQSSTTALWRYDVGVAQLRPVVYLASSSAGYFVGASAAIPADSAVPVGDALGSWRGPSSLGRLAWLPAPERVLEIRRFQSGAQRDVNVHVSGAESYTPGSWTYAGPGVADYQYRATFPQWPRPRGVDDCQSAFANGATGCAPSRVRYFRPQQRVGARLYGTVDFYTNSLTPPAGHTGPYDVQWLDSRAYYIECVAGACLASVPAAAP